jgi:hypothetical protein
MASSLLEVIMEGYLSTNRKEKEKERKRKNDSPPCFKSHFQLRQCGLFRKNSFRAPKSEHWSSFHMKDNATLFYW